jgi:hypothetical protein
MVQKFFSFKSFIMQHTYKLEDWKSLHNWSCWQAFFINLESLVSLHKTLRVLYKLSGFLKELGQKNFLILLSAVSSDLCQELWGVHCFVVSSVLSSVCKLVLWRTEIREPHGRKSTNFPSSNKTVYLCPRSCSLLSYEYSELQLVTLN